MNSCYNLLVIVTYGDYVMKHKSLLLLALPLLFSSCTKVDAPAFSVVENEKDDTNSDQPLSDEIVKEVYDSKTENSEVEISDEDRIQEETAAKISERQSQNKILRTNRLVSSASMNGSVGLTFNTFLKDTISVSECQITAINDVAKNSFTINPKGSITANFYKLGDGLIGKFEVSLKSDPTIKEELTLEVYTKIGIQKFIEYKVNEEDNTASIVSVDKNLQYCHFYYTYEKDGVSYPVTRIEDYAFANCISFQNPWAFDGSAYKFANLEYIGKYAFYNCQSLTYFYMNITSITPLAILDKTFYNCTKLNTFQVTSSVFTSIGKYAFYNCKKLTVMTSNGVAAGANLEFVDDFAFANSAFTGLIPASVTKRIGYAAFMNCPLYADIVFNDSLEEIDDFAFANVSKIATIKIGSKLKTVASTAFLGCNYNLTKLTIDTNNPNFIAVNNGLLSKDGKIVYSASAPYYGKTTVGSTGTYTEVKDYAYYKGAGPVGANMYSFAKCVRIGDYAFANVRNDFYIDQSENPSSLSYLGKGAFKNTKISKIILNTNNLTEISESTFENCSNLTSITLPANVTKIGKNAFKNCTSLTTINGLENVTEIEEGAFRGCSKLTAVNLNSIKHIGNFAFKGCSKAVIKFKTGVDTSKFDEFWNIDNLNYQEIA